MIVFSQSSIAFNIRAGYNNLGTAVASHLQNPF